MFTSPLHRNSYLATLASSFGFILFDIICQYLLRSPPVAGLVIFIILPKIPMIACLPWIINRSTQACTLLAYLCLFYFCAASLNVFTEPNSAHNAQQIASIVSAILLVATFISALVFIRVEKRHN